eukprot:SAG11_NODE_4489_length_1870_cov_4.340461_1_plen_41_part_10
MATLWCGAAAAASRAEAGGGGGFGCGGRPVLLVAAGAVAAQ